MAALSKLDATENVAAPAYRAVRELVSIVTSGQWQLRGIGLETKEVDCILLEGVMMQSRGKLARLS